MNVLELVATLSLDRSGYDKGLDTAEKSGGKFGGGLKKAAKGAGIAVAAASGAAVAFGKSAVSAGAEFDTAMSQVAATMGKTTDEIGDLRDFAQEMGATTAFSATESAEALNYMALAGYDAETSMGMLPNVLNLAAAGSMDLAQASDMITDTQSALGLSLGETTQLVDKMAKTASTTNTSVSQLGSAMLTVGGTAKMMKGGTTEISAALGILADAGTKGSEGGTALRNVLTTISGKKFEKSFGALGVEAYDASGKLRSLKDILADMNEVMEGMTEQEKTKLINNTFNARDLKNVNTLLDAGTQKWDKLTTAIDDSAGAAGDMADTQLDNLAGDITFFQSALEGAQIAVSDGLTPTLREFVQTGTDGLSQVTQALQKDGLDGAMEALGTWLSGAIQTIVEKVPTMVEAGMKLLIALIQGIIDNLPKMLEAAMEIVLSIANGISENLPTLIPALVAAILMMANTLLDNLDLLIDAALALMVGLAEGLVAAIPEILIRVPRIIDGLISALISFIPKIAFTGVKLLLAIVKNLPRIIFGIVSVIPRIIAAIVRGIVGGVKDIAKAGVDLMKGLAKGIKDGIRNAVDAAKEAVGSVLGVIRSLFGIHSPSKVMAEFGKYLDEGLAQGISGNMDVAKKAMSELSDVISQPMSGAIGFAASAFDGAGEEFTVPVRGANFGSERDLTVILELDKTQLGKAVYRLNNEESQRVGTKLAGGYV